MINNYDIYQEQDALRDGLNTAPFIIMIGKYDQILGPRSLYSSVEIKNQDFIRNLLRDSLNTKNKFVIIDFNKFYSQICKVEIEDKKARGGKQLYAIILLRHSEYPLIPTIHFKRIEMIFHKIGSSRILSDDAEIFKKFARSINQIYFRKDEVLPMESFHHKIRSGVNTIQGFCQLVMENEENKMVKEGYSIKPYLELILDSCDDIMNAIEEHLSKSILK